MKWTTLISDKRFGKETAKPVSTEQRTDFQRDYDRLIFSPPFRRMQNKTQVFPLPGSIFVHNRLTHSLEVSSVGRSLGADVCRALTPRHPEAAAALQATPAIVSAACLAHDMGNPPFGHSGEKAICSFFSEGRGARLRDYVSPEGEKLTDALWSDITHFDGNANTFRLLTHQFAGRRQGGFVMTYATLAAIVKYPYSSALSPKPGKFGFFETEKDDFLRIARELGMPCTVTPQGVSSVRHPLVYLVEAADDICYEIMDVEDAFKLRLLSAEETISLFMDFFDAPTQRDILAAYPATTDKGDHIAYLRSCVINALERACVKVFVDHEEDLLAGTFEGSLIGRLPSPLREAFATVGQLARRRIYNCKEVTDIDLAGYHIIYTLLDLLTEAVLAPEKAYSRLLLSQASPQYELTHPSLTCRIMGVLDYISGMTDVFALDLYRKINGHSLPGV